MNANGQNPDQELTREQLEGALNHLRNIVSSLQQQVAQKAVEVAEREAIIQSLRDQQQPSATLGEEPVPEEVDV